MNDCIADAFWKFSLALYACSGVAERLVELQDEHDADVNMVLFCCWCGKEGRMPLEDAFFQEADRYLHEWRLHVVETLLQKRVDPCMLDATGDSPWRIALRSGNCAEALSAYVSTKAPSLCLARATVQLIGQPW